MPKLKPITPAKLIKILERFGFGFFRRAKGSHVLYGHPDGRIVLLPIHCKDVPTGTLSDIIKDAGLDREDLFEGKKK